MTWAKAWGPYHITEVDASPFADVLRHFARAYTYRELEAGLGISREVLRLIVTGDRTRIRSTTARRLHERLLDERWYTP